MSKTQSAGSIPAVSLLYGKRGKEDLFDEYLAAQHLARIKDALTGGAPLAASEFDAPEADLADVLDEVSTPSLWGSNRVTILREAESILSPAAADRERLIPFVARMTEIARDRNAPGHLVLVARALEVRERSPKTGFAQANELIAAIDEAGGLCPCIPPYERDVKAALARKAAEKGFQLAPSAMDALVAMVGTDQMALQEELDKLIAHAAGSRNISQEDVEAVAADRPEGNVFTLAEKILDGDVKAALSVLRGLGRTPATRSASFIIGGLSASFRRYLASAIEMERGAGAREAATSAGVPGYFQRDYVRRLERWNAATLAALLRRALQCDVEVKNGIVQEDVALDTFVVEACGGNLERRELVGRWLYEVEI